MKKIKVVNLKNWEGGKVIKVDRTSPLGNSSRIGKDGTRNEVIAKYRRWLWDLINGKIHDPEAISMFMDIVKAVEAVEGEEGEVVLGCHCVPKPCHAEVIKKAVLWWIANQ